FDPNTPHPVIALVTEWRDETGQRHERNERSALGGTMRLGAQVCLLAEGSRARAVYGSAEISERHRHRFEFNNRYQEEFERAGFRLSGRSRDGLVEMIELEGHPWFLASQFHPEFTSNPRDGHPLFTSFVNAARECQGLKLPRAVEA